jgi:hypothetical protein
LEAELDVYVWSVRTKCSTNQWSEGSLVDEEPNIDATGVFELIKDCDEPLWDKCTNHSKLSIISWVFTIKSDYDISEVDFDSRIEWEKNILQEENRLKQNFFAIKFMIKTSWSKILKNWYVPKFLHVVLWWRYKFNWVQNI